MYQLLIQFKSFSVQLNFNNAESIVIADHLMSQCLAAVQENDCAITPIIKKIAHHVSLEADSILTK